jgi:uncharacterized protein (DUF697 family)
MVEVYTPTTDKEAEARRIVNKYMLYSIGVGVLPVPFLDTVGLLAVQLRMLQVLSQHYDVPFSRDVGKKLVSAMLGTVVPASLSTSLWSAVKVVPGLSLIAGLTMPAFAGAATYAIGKVFIQHFESGGTFLDFEPAEVREYYRQEFERGRTFATEAQADAPRRGRTTPTDV